MIRPICCLAITFLAAACVPPKAVLVEAAPVARPKAKPGDVAPVQDSLPPMPLVAQQNGMRVPTENLNRLPDRKDFTATTQPKAGGGGTVIATPPTGDKPANE